MSIIFRLNETSIGCNFFTELHYTRVYCTMIMHMHMHTRSSLLVVAR